MAVDSFTELLRKHVRMFMAVLVSYLVLAAAMCVFAGRFGFLPEALIISGSGFLCVTVVLGTNLYVQSLKGKPQDGTGQHVCDMDAFVERGGNRFASQLQFYSKGFFIRNEGTCESTWISCLAVESFYDRGDLVHVCFLWDDAGQEEITLWFRARNDQMAACAAFRSYVAEFDRVRGRD